MMKLISFDGQPFDVLEEVGKKCGTVKNLVEEVGTENPLPLPDANVTGPILNKILEFAKNHHENARDFKEEDLTCYDLDFFKEIDQETLFGMILATNYLEYTELLDVCCRYIANTIRGKTTEEIRQLYNIENDFTAEEEAAVERENEWMNEE